MDHQSSFPLTTCRLKVLDCVFVVLEILRVGVEGGFWEEIGQTIAMLGRIKWPRLRVFASS